MSELQGVEDLLKGRECHKIQDYTKIEKLTCVITLQVARCKVVYIYIYRFQHTKIF